MARITASPPAPDSHTCPTVPRTPQPAVRRPAEALLHLVHSFDVAPGSADSPATSLRAPGFPDGLSGEPGLGSLCPTFSWGVSAMIHYPRFEGAASCLRRRSGGLGGTFDQDQPGVAEADRLKVPNPAPDVNRQVSTRRRQQPDARAVSLPNRRVCRSRLMLCAPASRTSSSDRPRRDCSWYWWTVRLAVCV